MTDAARVRRILYPFDAMRANRVLAPHDPKLNDIRWLIGEALRRTHGNAETSPLAAVTLRRAEERVGTSIWPILVKIIVEGAGVRDCRAFVPELATPWRADAVITDRLRVGLDLLGPLMEVTSQ
jgi:hypothetical protein